MEMISKQISGTSILRLIGRIDAYTAPPFEKLFQKLSIDPLSCVIVDLSQVDFIDSTGLATLVIGMKRCRQQQGELVLCGIQQPIRTIFELTRLDTVFTIVSTQEDAIAYAQTQQKGKE
jgi:anti-sigma B factor antagonist